jgi:glyoxylase-like metal-dependent hydrolase (beta-lactamase superfamily II)
MFLLPFLDTTHGCASYLIGDNLHGEAAVIDPLASIGVRPYVLSAQQIGCSITQVIETHIHADHRSGAWPLGSLLNVSPAWSHRAAIETAFTPLRDGMQLRLGHVQLTVWETPGHTPESISLIVTDLSRSTEPWAIFVGDCLFSGDVGRPDLVAASSQDIEQAARCQWQSLQRLLTLPDYVTIYPAHFGSSPCGGIFLSGTPFTTLGFERRFNRFLGQENQQAFIASVRRFLRVPPDHSAAVRRANLDPHAMPNALGQPSAEEGFEHVHTN